MSEGWEQVRLGHVVHLDIEKVLVQSATSYRLAGVLNHGQGLIDRGPLPGDATNYPVMYRLRRDQLVMRKLTAWEGTLAVVPESFEGFVVSPEFPTFSLDADSIDPDYLRLVCGTATMWEQMKLRVRGTVQRRKRLNPDDLLQVQIMLPSLVAQRRIVNLIEAVSTALDRTRHQHQAGQILIQVLSRSTVDTAGPRLPLGQFVQIAGKLVDPKQSSFAHLPHVGIERIEGATGFVRKCATAQEDGITSGKFIFQPGQVVYSKIRPELRKAFLAKSAGLCSADAYPLTCGDLILPEYLLEVLLSDTFTAESVAKSGRTKMPKVNRLELLSIPIPVPPLNDQERIAGLLGALRVVFMAVTEVEEQLEQLRAALLSDLLTGKHEVPETYDSLMSA
jgi:type I restriction enzyme, S subunit